LCDGGRQLAPRFFNPLPVRGERERVRVSEIGVVARVETMT
jgi:hypothetical protein